MGDRWWTAWGTSGDGPQTGHRGAKDLQTLEKRADNTDTMQGRLGIPTIRPGGKLGNVVFLRTQDGYVVRERITPANPRTPLQTATRREFAVASQSWKGLPDAAFAAWQAYAEVCGRTAYHVYMGLTRKWLAVHKGGTPPTMPPSGPFFGDAVRLTIDGPPLPSGGEGQG